MKQIACNSCDASFPVGVSVAIAKARALHQGWTVGGLFYNKDYCPDHSLSPKTPGRVDVS